MGQSLHKKIRRLFERQYAGWLREFWRRATEEGDTPEERIALLCEFSARFLFTPRKRDKARYRRSMAKRAVSDFHSTGAGDWHPCFGCWRPADVRHHIVMLSAGGDNRGANVVKLCDPCHAKVHTWLDHKNKTTSGPARSSATSQQRRREMDTPVSDTVTVTSIPMRATAFPRLVKRKQESHGNAISESAKGT